MNSQIIEQSCSLKYLIIHSEVAMNFRGWVTGSQLCVVSLLALNLLLSLFLRRRRIAYVFSIETEQAKVEESIVGQRNLVLGHAAH